MIKGKTNCYLSKKDRKKSKYFIKKNLKISFLILGKGDTISFKFLPRLVLDFVFLTLMISAVK